MKKGLKISACEIIVLCQNCLQMTSSLLAYNVGDKLSHRKYSETVVINSRPPSWDPDIRKSLSVPVSILTFLVPTLRSSQKIVWHATFLACNFDVYFELDRLRCSKHKCYVENIRYISSRCAQKACMFKQIPHSFKMEYWSRNNNQ